jgi:serine/threonine-protein kinase
MTNAGMILGTAAYMAPEQARGKAVDRRADIWAFGCVLYEMLTGRRAFEGDGVADVIASVLRSEPEWRVLPAVPPPIRSFLRQCLRKDPRKRVGDIQDVRLALEGEFDLFSAPDAAGSAPSPRLLPLAALALVVGILGSGLVAWSYWPAAESRIVTRFAHLVAEGLEFRQTSRPILAISPDGRHLIYNVIGGGREGLYLRTMGELEARRIPGTEAVLVANPFFSPDGEAVAYFAPPDRLVRQSLNGGPPVLMAGGISMPQGASWNADDTILFAQAEGIMRVRATGGSPEQVIAAGEGEELYGPSLLPDGDSVLFSVTTSIAGETRWDVARIVVESLSSGRRTVLVEGGSEARYLPGGYLTYAVGETLFAVAYEAGDERPTGEPVPVLQGVLRAAAIQTGANQTGAANYAVSRNGTLAYVAGGTGAGLRPVWVDRRGAAAGIDTAPPGTTPRLSPDGERVLLEVEGNLWIYELASGRGRRVTTGGGQRGSWDPAGSLIAFTSARTGRRQAWVVPADGSGEARQLTDLEGAVDVDSWSPDGRLLALHQHTVNGAMRILMLPMDEADATARPFAERDELAEGAVFSPDGGYVAYASSSSGQREVYIRPYPGPGAQAIVSIGGGQQPVWADNGELFYRDLTGERMLSVSVVTDPSLVIGPPQVVFQGTYHNIAGGGSPRAQYDVTRDGQRFFMLERDATARHQIVVVEHWLEEVERLVPRN